MSTEKTNNPAEISVKETKKADRVSQIEWDDTNMRSSYANVFNVSSAREEIVIVFGMNHAWDTNRKKLKIKLSDRIVLNPHTAKRLSIMLNNAVKNYEDRFGSLEMETDATPVKPANQ